MKIAIDRQISPKINLPGHEIILWAGDEDDEVWIQRAVERGAEIFISPDLDVPNILDANNYEGHWIEYPQNLKKEKAEKYILNQLEKYK